jgi:ElaB/YqjD/DUF883 family membrane-anchored ribosome-binding protein
MVSEDYSMADFNDQAKDAIDEGAETAKKVAVAVADKAADVMSGVRDYADRVVGQTREGYGQVAERAQEGIRLADAVVRGNPGPSVATAFGVGIAIGVIVGLTVRSRRA